MDILTKIEQERIRIGSTIATRRNELKYSVRGLAELCGVSYQTITKIEHGRYNPSLDVLVKISDALKMEINLELNKRP